MTNLKIHDLPLNEEQVDRLTKQYSVSKKEMQIGLQHIEDSVDPTDDVDVLYLLHHMFNYARKVHERK